MHWQSWFGLPTPDIRKPWMTSKVPQLDFVRSDSKYSGISKTSAKVHHSIGRKDDKERVIDAAPDSRKKHHRGDSNRGESRQNRILHQSKLWVALIYIAYDHLLIKVVKLNKAAFTSNSHENWCRFEKVHLVTQSLKYHNLSNVITCTYTLCH